MARPDIDARLKIMTVIWLALSMGVLSFAAVAYGLVFTGSMGEPTLDSSLVTMVAPVLLAMMAGGVVLGRRLESGIPRDAPDDEKINRYQTARIIALATQEGPALAVIAMGLISGAGGWIAAAAAVGVWSMFLARPRREDLEALLRG